MAHSSPTKLGLALALVLITSQTIADEKCASGCQGGSSIFKYSEGTTYKYNYEGSIDISLSTAEGQQSVTKVKAVVLLTQLPQCNQLLRLQNVQIIGAEGKKYTKLEGINQPIRINFNDGKINDVICVEPGDNQNSINIKRAIASFFQANLKGQYETDVFGLCPTDVLERKEGDAVVIQKNRNLNKCAYRESLKQDFLATAFNLNSEIKTSPILNGDYTSQQRIKNGILDQATITENYLYMPFSVGRNGAKAVVQSKIQYVSTSKESPKSKVSEPRSIIFENPHIVNDPKSDENTALAAVKAVAGTIDDTVSQSTAKHFLDLVKILRVSKKDDLLNVYNKVKAGVGFRDKEVGKKIFLDALFRAGTGESIEVAIELLKSKQLSEIEQRIVYLGLGFVKHATKSSLLSAASLLDQPNLPREAFLGVGTLAGRFCKEHSCKNLDELNKLSQKFLSKLGDGKGANRQQENEIIYVLKALGNINFLNDAVVAKVIAIARNNKAPNRLRAAALETYLADACNDKLRDSALALLKDINLDSEIRIKAYLVLAQCPNGKVANALKTLLEDEPSYQVGGFIVSHLKNIRASANPDKELAKQQLGLIGLPNRFPFDLRKYSFNGEFSFAADSFGVANAIESNIIYSQDSFLPRSTSLNLTTELFGHSFNFLEIATRQENLDRLFEHYLGPKGVFSRKNILNELEAGYSDRDLDLDLSVKLFGSEFLFLNLNENVAKYTPEVLSDKVSKYFEKGLDEAKSFDKSVSSNVLFIDAELGYPTSLGFPLRLGVEGSSAVQVKAEGNIDLRALRKLDQDVNLKLSLVPSANIEISGKITLDAQIVENGLKVSTTLFTATGGDLNVQIFKGGKGFDVKFSLPVEKQKIISATHDIVFSSREIGQGEKNHPLKFSQNNDFQVCLDQLSKFIGLTACGEMNGPNLSGDHVPILPFPLNGNSKYIVTLEREDLSEYHVRLSTYTDSKAGLELVAEALDGKGGRKVALQLEGFLAPERYIKAVLNSPIKNIVGELKLETSDRAKALIAKFQNDDKEYYAKAGVDVSGSGSKTIFKPVLEYKSPEDKAAKKPPYNVEGVIEVETNGNEVNYVFDDIRINAPNKNYISVKGLLQSKPDLKKVNIEVQNTFNPLANFGVKYEFKKQPDGVQNSIQLIHGKDLSSKTNIITFVNSITYKYKNANDYLIGSKNKFSYPLINVDAKFEFESTPKSFDYDIDAKYKQVSIGSELDLKYSQKVLGDYQLEFEVYGFDNRLEVESKREVLGDGKKSKIDNSVELNGEKLSVTGTINHFVQPQNVDVGADLVVKVPRQTNPIKLNVGFVLNANDLDTQFKVSAGSNNVDFFLKGTRGLNANGALKLNIDQILTANGQIKAVKGVGNANIVIKLLKSDKELKVESTYTVQNPVYNVEVSFYPNFGKNKGEKFTLSTKNKITENSIDSNNFAEAQGKKVEVNVQGALQGQFNNGKQNGEVEIILPNEFYILGKLNRDIKTTGDIINGNALLSLEYRKNRNAPGSKLSLKGTAKDANIKTGVYDLLYNLAADDSNGKTFNSDLGIKRAATAGGSVLEVNYKAYGSVLKNPFESALVYNQKENTGDFKLTSSCGSGTNLNLNGAYGVEVGKTYSGSLFTELKTPFSVLKVFRLKTDGSASSPQTADELFSGKGSLELFIDNDLKQQQPVDLTLKGEVTAKRSSGSANIELDYAKDKSIKADVSITRPNKGEYTLDVKLVTPSEKAKNINFRVNTKRLDEQKKVNSEVLVTVDGKKFTLTSELVFLESSPSVKFVLQYPDGKEDKFIANVEIINRRNYNGNVKVVYNPAKFAYDGSIEADLEDIEDFSIRLTADSPYLKLYKWEIQANNKAGAKGAKRIQFSATSEGKNAFSGSTSYKVHQEGDKFIVEGSGDVKIKDKSKSANFKFIKQSLSLEKNGEKGVEFSFDAVLGDQAIDSELKITNKQFRLLDSYCEEKKKCAHIEIDSKTNTNDIANYNNELEIAIDLRKLGLTHEFGLKALTTRKQFIFDHTVDVYFQNNEKSKYQYSVYFHPKKAGASLTTPKRVIAAEAVISGEGPYNAEAALYLDKKNQPNQKTAITGFLGFDRGTKKLQASAEFKNPALKKPLSSTLTVFPYEGETKGLGFELTLDVFADQNNKFVVTGRSTLGQAEEGNAGYEAKEILEIKNKGLDIEIKVGETVYVDDKSYTLRYKSGVRYKVKGSRFDTGVLLSASPKQVDGSVKLLNRNLLSASLKLNLGKESQTAEGTLEIYGVKPLVNSLEIKNFNTVKYVIARKENPNDKLEINSGFIIGQVADFRAEVFKAGAKKELVHGTVKLDEAQFLKTDFGYNSENVKNYILKPSKETNLQAVKEVKELLPQLYKEAGDELSKLGEILSKTSTDFKPLRDYYVKEGEEIKEEILQDKTIKEINDFLKGIIGAVIQSVREVLTKLNELVENLVQTLQASFQKVIESFNKEILPKLKEISEKILNVLTDAFEKFSETFFAYLGKVSQFIDENQATLKEIASSFNAIGQDLGRFLVKSYENLRKFFVQQYKTLSEEFKALPVYEELKRQLEALKTQYAKDVDQVFKKLELLKTDVRSAVEEFLKNVINALNQLAQRALAIDVATSPDVQLFSVDYLSKLPKLVAIKFSPLSYLLSGGVTNPWDLLFSITPNPHLWFIPIPIYGIVAQGQHIFTFDGKHLTFPGKCNYVLAKDEVDGNFTISGTYTNGLLTAITLADKSESITIKKGGQVLLNNAASEYPVVKGDLVAFRKYESVNLVSKAGVHVVCGLELVVCGIHISGFYFGRLRGLLGNPNYEPYDDFTLPNGKLAKTESEFGNAYKQGGSCPAVKAFEHHVHQSNPSCARLFGWESSLRYCYKFVNPDNYKMACEHGLAEGVKDTEFAVAVSYVAACNWRGIPIRVPEEFVRCKNADQEYKLGDKFSVKTPGKSADVLLLVDLKKANEPVYKELVQPLVQKLNQELNGKGINDVEYHLIAFGGEYETYPAHVTVGGKLTFKGKAPNLKFSDPENKPFQLNCDKLEKNKFIEYVSGYVKSKEAVCPKINKALETLQDVIHDLNLAVGNYVQAKTYGDALRYPFRAQAAKIIVAVTGDQCEVGTFLPLQILRSLFYTNNEVYLNLITPLADFNLKDAKTTKEAVGFNKYNVFTTSLLKKKPEGSADLYKQLEYTDYCSKFTVFNGGNVFISSNFLQAKGGARNQFVQVAAHNIVDQVTSFEKGLDCECQYVSPYSGQAKCKVVHTNEKPRKS